MFAAFKLIGWQVKLGILVALLAIMGAIYYVGYTKGENVSRVEIAKYEGKVEKLNADLAKAQGKVYVQIVTQYKDRLQYVDRVITKTRTVVEQSVPEQFKFSKGWVYSFNQSILGLDVDPKLASNEEASSVSDMRALSRTIIPNNGVCLSNAEQLKALQQWTLDSQAAREKVNEK